MKKIVLMLVAALVCTGAVAKDKKTNKKKQAQPVEVVDTISIDQFSALMGCVNTQGLQQYLLQQKGIDAAYMKDFLEGFGVGEMTESDKKQKARIAGMEIRQQVVAQMLPSINRQIDDTQDRINTELFLKGFMAGVEGKDVDGIPMDSASMLVQKNMQYYHQVQMERKYGQNRQEGVDFLAKNAKRGEVKTTPSGLQYEILVKGDGPVAQATDRVKVHYRGTLIDGTEFDSSYKRGEPATFGVGQVIKGWTEALTMMPTGSKWMLYIPQELAYGDRESGKIKPFSALIFEVELLEVVK